MQKLLWRYRFRFGDHRTDADTHAYLRLVFKLYRHFQGLDQFIQ